MADRWRPLFLYLFCFFLFWTIRATVLFRWDERITTDTRRAIYSNGLKLAIWVLPVMIFVGWRRGQPVFKWLRLSGRITGRGFTVAAIIIVGYLAATVAFEGLAHQRYPTIPHQPFGALAVAIASTAISSLFEEILFRGFFLRELWERIRFPAANAGTAILFVLVHWPNWLWSGNPWTTVVARSVPILLLALFMGYLVKLSRSLWPAVVLHVLNNILAMILQP